MNIAAINAKWDAVCTVKNSSLPSIHDLSGLCYTPELVRHAQHAEVSRRGLRRAILVEQFYYFQGFTSKLELELVNPIFTRIAHGTFPAEIDADLIERCHQIICDEAYHALSAYNLIKQVEASEGIGYTVPAMALMDRLDEIRASYPARHTGLIDVFFVIVSECLVTANLQIMSQDSRLKPGIWRTIKDHADDEAFHRISCIHLLKTLWRSFDSERKQLFRSVAPALARAYLAPDVRHIHRSLCAHGMSADDADRVVTDCYASSEAHAAVEAGVGATMEQLHAVVARIESRLDDAATASNPRT